MKYLISHINPHLDEISSIWLIRKLHPDFKDAEVGFVWSNAKLDEVVYKGKHPDEDPDFIFLGVGGGRFDEHWGNKGVNITTTDLVWDWLKSLNYLPAKEAELNALGKISAFTLKDDTGALKNEDQSVIDFSVTNIISASNFVNDSLQTVNLVLLILDALYALFIRKEEVIQDFNKRVEIDTKWGKAMVVDGELTPGDPFDALTYNCGGVLMILVDRKYGYRQFRAKSDSSVDLSEIYEGLRKAEPDADWFLHPNKKLLVNGGNVTVGRSVQLSRLTKEDLIKLVS